MKKIIAIFILMFYIINLPVFARQTYRVLDLQKKGDFLARIALYKFVLNELNMTPTQAKNYANIDFKTVHAYNIDLNDDNNREIIGYISVPYYWGTSGYSLYILKRTNKIYKDIASCNFEPQNPIIVTKHKTYEYKNLIISGSSADNFRLFIIKFDGQKYVNNEQENILWQYMKNFADYDVSKIAK